MNNSERKRQSEIRISKVIAVRFLSIADKIQSLIDGRLVDDISAEEYQILQNEADLFRDLASQREGTR